MSFAYRRGDLRSGNITDAVRFNENLNEQVANLQGLDRDQLPTQAVSESMIADKAFNLLEVKQTNAEIADPYRASSPPTDSFPSWVCAPGMQYTNYSGDDVVAFTESTSVQGGILQVEFSAWVFRNNFVDRKYISSVPSVVNNSKALRFKLLVNGIEVDSTANVYVPWMSIHLCGQVLAPEGRSEIQVVWSMDPAATFLNGQFKDPADFVMLFFSGSSLLINQRRS
jgi:hypothetical protein